MAQILSHKYTGDVRKIALLDARIPVFDTLLSSHNCQLPDDRDILIIVQL